MGDSQAPPLTEKLLTVDICWGKRNHFFKDEFTNSFAVLQFQWIFMHIWAALTCLIGLMTEKT